MKGLSIFLAIFCMACNAFLHANSFDDGLKAANAKNYKQAIYHFEKCIKTEPQNSAAFYNLGNTFYKNKEFGKAIWAFETAIKLNPKNEEAPINIELCYRELTNGNSWQSSISGLQRMIYGIGSTTWAILSIVISCLIGYSVFSLLKRKTTPWKRFHVMALFADSILFIGFLIAANSSANYPSNHDYAIITAKTSRCYLEETSKTADFSVNEGAKVHILSEKTKRVEVELLEGRKVFISKKDLRII